MLVKNLKANAKNPRKISASKREELKKTLEEYGDIGCIVFNTRTERLVAGHQRVSQIDGSTKVIITQKFPEPTKQGTVAEGYIEVGGERFKYREVHWDEAKETKAMLAANKVGGEWDRDLLAVLMTEIKFDVSKTGFDANDLKDLKIEIPKVAAPVIETRNPFADTNEGGDSSPERDEDADYIRDNPGPDSQLDKERIPSMVNETKPADAFQETKEKTDIVGKRYMIIIDCKDQEAKDALKEKLGPIIEEAGAKIF